MPDQEPVTPGAPTRGIPGSKMTWIIVAIIVVALAWFIPSHIRLIRERDELKTKVSTYEKHSHTETHRKPVALPNGQIGYEEDTVTDNEDKGRIAESDKKHDKEDLTIDRGKTTVLVLFGDSEIPKGATFNTTIVGPVSAGAYTGWDNGFKVLVGAGISF